MRLYTLALSLSSLVACTPASEATPDADTGVDADPDAPADPRKLTISWQIKALDGSATGCPAGFTEMEIWITNNQYDGYWQKVIKQPCAGSGTHVETVFTSGREFEDGGVWTHGKIHDIRIVITEPTGQVVAAGAPSMPDGQPPSPGRFITLDQDRTAAFDIYPAGGYGYAKWHLVSNNTSADLISCAAAGVDKIRFTYFMGYYPGTTTPIVTEWPCDAKDVDFPPDEGSTQLGSGRTRAVPVGVYYGTFQALRNGVVVGTRGGDGDAIGFDSNKGNTAFRITRPDITINDR